MQTYMNRQGFVNFNVSVDFLADVMLCDAVTQNVTEEHVILQHKNPSLDEVVSILEQCETFESAVVDMQLPIITAVDTKSQPGEYIFHFAHQHTTNGLMCNHTKCVFCVHQVKYLGHVTDTSGIRPVQKHLDAISQLPAPRNVSELQSVFRKLSNYINFRLNTAQIATSLHCLHQKHVEFWWSHECSNAFQRLKDALLSTPFLMSYNPAKTLILAMNAFLLA